MPNSQVPNKHFPRADFHVAREENLSQGGEKYEEGINWSIPEFSLFET